MPTKPLPFYEKDAVRWHDLVVDSTSELRRVLRSCANSHYANHVEAIIWQLENVTKDIDKTLKDRRR